MEEISVGWHLGGVYDFKRLFNFEIGQNTFSAYLQPGFYVSALGYGESNGYYASDGHPDIDVPTSTYWVEIPVLLSFRREPSKADSRGRSAFRFEIGPYVNIGLFGDFKAKEISTVTNKPIYDRSRFDIGLTVGSVVEYGPFWVAVSLSQGFVKKGETIDWEYWGNTGTIKYKPYNALYFRIPTVGINF